VGTGKTLLCRRLLQALPEGSISAYLPNPYLAPRTLLLALAEELGVEVSGDSDDYHVLQSVNRALLAHAAADRQVVVCIDEAQAMPLETLESLRLLSNLETEKRKLLQIVLFGQPELDRKLADPSVRQLLQRIAFHYRLAGLAREEIANYLAHRLRVAGYRGEVVFGSRAVRCLHRASRGTPRLLNILAHKSLLAVYGEASTRCVRPMCARRPPIPKARLRPDGGEMSLINDMLRNIEAKRPDDPARQSLQREIRSLPTVSSGPGWLLKLLVLMGLLLAGVGILHLNGLLLPLLGVEAGRVEKLPVASLPAPVAPPRLTPAAEPALAAVDGKRRFSTMICGWHQIWRCCRQSQRRFCRCRTRSACSAAGCGAGRTEGRASGFDRAGQDREKPGAGNPA
jgi:MSHA biogenesis protein MshM